MGGEGGGDRHTNKQRERERERERESRQTRDIITETAISSSHLFAIPILVL
jgi:hypothetical protein